MRGKSASLRHIPKDFCKSCNRLRVTSRGKLMLCLFGEGGYVCAPICKPMTSAKNSSRPSPRRAAFRQQKRIYSKESPAPRYTLPHSEDR
ncbi:MAG: hypothetical protein U1E36_02485 [Rickettsiales bacterium]